jgi:hypothetical protein
MSTATAYGPRSAAPLRRPEPLRLVAPPSHRRPAVGVYRRRRLVAVLALALLLVVTARAAGSLLSTASAGEPARTPVVLVAEPGDSYWSLASEVHEGGDLRSTVDALVAANGGRDLRVGDRIVLPG